MSHRSVNFLGKAGVVSTLYFQGWLEERKTVQRAVKTEIRKAREAYKDETEVRPKRGGMHSVWKGIKTMADIPMRRSDLVRQLWEELKTLFLHKM